MFEHLCHIEIFVENDMFFGKVHTPTGLREYKNLDYDDLVSDMFSDLQDEEVRTSGTSEQ